MISGEYRESKGRFGEADVEVVDGPRTANLGVGRAPRAGRPMEPPATTVSGEELAAMTIHIPEVPGSLLLLVSAIPVQAQDELLGTWEQIEIEEGKDADKTERFALFLTFDQDGTFQFEITFDGNLTGFFGDFVLELVAEVRDAAEGGDPDVTDTETGIYANVELGDGTFLLALADSWEVQGDELDMAVETTELTMSGLALGEFFVPVLDRLVAESGDESGMSAEEAEEVRSRVLLELPALLEDFDTAIADEVGGTVTFDVTGDTLVLTDEGGDDDWSRSAVPSAVTPVTWGQAKAARR